MTTSSLTPAQMDRQCLLDMLRQTHVGTTVPIPFRERRKPQKIHIVDLEITDDPSLVFWATYA